jgi:hypothetical protein
MGAGRRLRMVEASMSAETISKERVRAVIKDWRELMAQAESDYSQIAPLQTAATIKAIQSCIDDLEELLK